MRRWRASLTQYEDGAAERVCGANWGLRRVREGDACAWRSRIAGCDGRRGEADFTLTFRRLCDAAAAAEGDVGVRALFAEPGTYDAWAVGWRRRLEEETILPKERAAGMRRTNPACIPRNHRVAEVIDTAVEREDFGPFEVMLDVVARPYEERPGLERYTTPARPEECVRETFCGT